MTPQERASNHLITLQERLALQLRLPLPGERFQPNAAPGSKRVTRLWSDRKVPIFERNRLPVLDNGKGKILWAPYCRPHRDLIAQSNTQAWLLTWRLGDH